MSDSALATFEDAARDAAEHAANPKQRKNLSLMDRAYILKARQQTPPATIDAIAAVIGCHRATVMRVLAAAQIDAPAILRTYTETFLEHCLTASEVAASKGYDVPARNALISAGALEPIADKSHSPSLAIQVNLALSPGTPAYAPPQPLALDAPTLTIETHALEHTHTAIADPLAASAHTLTTPATPTRQGAD